MHSGFDHGRLQKGLQPRALEKGKGKSGGYLKDDVKGTCSTWVSSALKNTTTVASSAWHTSRIHVEPNADASIVSLSQTACLRAAVCDGPKEVWKDYVVMRACYQIG